MKDLIMLKAEESAVPLQKKPSFTELNYRIQHALQHISFW